MTDEEWSIGLSDRSVLGHRVWAAAERISRRRMFSDLSAADRDDLVGITIGKYYATWGPLGRPDNIEAWLSTVMYRAMMDLFRERRKLHHPSRRAEDGSLETLLEDWMPAVPSLSAPVVAQDAADAFLRRLSPADARLLWLKSQRYSSREIGELLDLRANAVDVRLHRLRIRVRELLSPEPDGEGDHEGEPTHSRPPGDRRP